ncbi:MAG: hypothetical protein DMF84_00795 [Acidobacteria bacterium]|nr:MAG: hypothetical protein DMF84_00795 [Acidobacteriota bacterium]
MAEASANVLRLVAGLVQVAFGKHPKRADRRQHAALGTVDLIDPVALPDQFALVAARQVEILSKHVARVGFVIAIALARAATTAATSIAGISSLAVRSRSRIVPVPHQPLPSR